MIKEFITKSNIKDYLEAIKSVFSLENGDWKLDVLLREKAWENWSEKWDEEIKKWKKSERLIEILQWTISERHQGFSIFKIEEKIEEKLTKFYVEFPEENEEIKNLEEIQLQTITTMNGEYLSIPNLN